MFGYIRPFKPHLRMCEYDTYKAVYCGLCKEMGREFSFPSRFTLSYDFAFLGLLMMSINESEIKISNQNCIAHPHKKSPCIENFSELKYVAATTSLSVYHKLKDDISDKGLKSKLIAASVLPFVSTAYKKAYGLYPNLGDFIANQMKSQALIEKNACKSLDNAAEPTAQIMGEIAKRISSDVDQQRILFRFGYLLGRFVYIVDALDDVEKDFKSRSYNPLLLLEGCDNCNMEKIKEIATDGVFFTLGELANSYTLLNINKFKSILDNIVYLGLRNTFESIKNKKEIKND